LTDRYVHAFNTADARALADVHSSDARYYDNQGELLEGRDAIRERFAQIFAAYPGITLKTTIDELRLLTPDVAVETGTAITTTKDNISKVTRYHAIHLKRDGQWQTTEVREFSAPDLPGNASNRLDSLSWLLGDWLDEGPEGAVRYQGVWDDPDRRRFLIRTFSITVQGHPAMTGTHRLGFDATLDQIRGWVFDSHGGFAEEFWFPSGPEEWFVKSSGVDAQGRRVTATHLVSHQSNQTVRILVLDHTVASEALPPGDTHWMARPPREPGK
jgi:uncharacterized protein (TIGR02246 family)